MEYTPFVGQRFAFVAHALFTGRQSPKVVDGLGDFVAVQTHCDSVLIFAWKRCTIHFNVEIHFGSAFGLFGFLRFLFGGDGGHRQKKEENENAGCEMWHLSVEY